MHSVHLFPQKDYTAKTKCIIIIIQPVSLCQAVANFENPEKIVCCFRIGTILQGENNFNPRPQNSVKLILFVGSFQNV